VTAEVAIANKLGIALAADSAVTITSHAGFKTYDTANKLFTLSKYHPVGVMFYGASEINTVPWEVLIKIHREQLGTTSFGGLVEYGDALLRLLKYTCHL
jgi:hypothetical protein